LRGATDGGQVQDVLPPSIHPTTQRRYELLTPLRPVSELPALPVEIERAWRDWKLYEVALRRLLGDADLARQDGQKLPKRPPEGVIDEFNRRLTVDDVLARNGYTARGPSRWLRPDSTTGEPGVVRLPEGSRVYAHCGGPLSDGHSHDAFDCFRLLEHGGDMRRAVRAAASELGIDRAANDDAGGAASWPDPEPLPSALPSVDSFDLELLPVALRGWVADVAERIGAPIDFAAAGMMVMLSGVLGRRVGIAPKRHDDWVVIPNLWGMSVGRPSSKKSPVMSAILEPLREIEREAELAHRAAMVNAAAAARVIDAKRSATADAIKKAARNGDDARALELAKALGEVEPDAVKPERFSTNDATVPKLTELLRDNPHGLLLLRDELAGFFEALERQGSEGDRQFYLETWNGNQPYTCDRIGRGTVHVPATCLAIYGSIQPGPLSALVRDSRGAGDDGLLPRFSITVWPDLGEHRLVDRLPDPKSRAQAGCVVVRFASMCGVAGSGPGPVPALRFDEPAQDEFLAWLDSHEKRMRNRVEHPLLESHLTKYGQAVPALALICHLCDHEGGPVGLVALRRALAWAKYLESHARRMYAPVMRPDIDAAHLLAKRLADGSLGDVFTARDVYRNGWTGLGGSDAVTVACDLLVRHSWLRAIEADTGGRPSVRYIVNPLIGQRRANAVTVSSRFCPPVGGVAGDPVLNCRLPVDFG
jgi:hypothetical protein